MARGLDHIVHAVRDLDAAADFYRHCGFTVGARNQHPWGTQNHVVQLPGFFIEILMVAEPDKLGDDGLSQQFGRPNQEAIAAGDGFSMLVLDSTDSAGDVADFKQAGIGVADSLPFSRQATMPDGSSARVGFTLAFARDARSPQTLFATCQQANPEAFWNAAYQRHDNGASAVAGVVLVAEKPDQHDGFLQAFTGVDDSEPRIDDVMLRTARGEIEVIASEVFRERYGALPKPGPGARLAGLRLVVDRLDDVESLLRNADIPTVRAGAILAVPPQAAFGATLIFEQTGIS